MSTSSDGVFSSSGSSSQRLKAFCARRVVLSTSNIPGLNRIPFADLMEDALGYPTFVNRDTNMLLLQLWRSMPGLAQVPAGSPEEHVQLAARLYEVHSAACRLAHFAVCCCGGKAAVPFSYCALVTGPTSVPTLATIAARPAPSIASLLAAVSHAAARRASDLLLSSGLAPRVRVDGELIELDDATTDADALRALVAHLGGDVALTTLDRDGVVDFGATIGAARVRGHGFHHERGVGVALRVLRTDVPTLASLGLPEDLTALVTARSGLVLVTGPTGSGKSTTLVALVGYLNHSRARHVITLEDPIEFLHEPDRCLIHQREVGRHAPTFASGLRAALREAPDVIVVGELRDAETIAIALTAAETGHLVLGTVHAPGAGGAIDRLIDAYPAHQQDQARAQVAAALRCVLTQHLLPTRNGGRAVALERAPVTPAIAALIRKNELQMLQTHLQTGRDAGMVPLERNLARLARSGLVDAAVARAAAIDLDYFDRALRGA